MRRKDKPKFDETMDETLLQNGFEYFDDWGYGPQCAWSEDWDHVGLKLSRHSFGYWIVFRRHAGGANPAMNIGSSNSAEEIIALRDMLKKCRNTTYEEV